MPAFISTPITPLFESEPVVRRRAGAPNAFLWDGERFEVMETLRTWSEAGQPWWRRRRWRNRRQHVSSLGRDYYRVRTAGGRVFDLYYDRRLEGRKVGGNWILWRELDGGDLDDEVDEVDDE